MGRKAVKQVLPELTQKYQPDFVIANAENSASGRGITAKIAAELFECGIDGLTMGNHTWDNKDIFNFIDHEHRLVRPANYPAETPGQGFTILRKQKKSLVVANLQGTAFLPPLACPFKTADHILKQIDIEQHRCIVVDFHAEATSEKIAMGWYLDGRVSALVGTHTHVQTHDEQVMPEGTAYVTDVGMTGPSDGVLGVEREAVLRKFITQMPVRFNPAKGSWHFHAVLVSIDEQSGKALKIQLIRIHEHDLMFLS